MTNRSLSTDIILRLLILSLLLVIAVSWLAIEEIESEADKLFDSELAQSARIILSLVQSDHDAASLRGVQKYLDENNRHLAPSVQFEPYAEITGAHASNRTYETRLAYQVWDDSGNLIIRSPNAPITPLTDITNGFVTVNADNSQWRIFSLVSETEKYRCLTAEQIDIRDSLIQEIIRDLVILSFCLIVGLSLIIWLTTRKSLYNLQKLAAMIMQRHPNSLDLLPAIENPKELYSITTAINNLIRDLDEAFRLEREITNDAAHELRTPLAAIKIHTELAASANTKEQRQTALSQVLKGIDRSTHMVDQLLNLARLDPGAEHAGFENCNFTNIVLECVSKMAHVAFEKDIEINVDCEDALCVRGDALSLQLMVNNLVDNAIKYTPDGGNIEISLTSTSELARLCIADNGPGIPVDEHDKVMQRFHRLMNHEVSGCGIGLSIVQRVCELHGASLRFEETQSSGGLTVIISMLATHPEHVQTDV